MKIIINYFIGGVLLIVLAACHPADATDSQGKPLYLTDYRGKWIVVNYWATWCKPCLTELPELNALQIHHADQLVVLGVSFDGLSNSAIQQFAKPLHLSFPLLSTFPKEKFGIKDIPSLPLTLIINPQGTLSQTLYGPQTQQSLLRVTLHQTNVK